MQKTLIDLFEQSVRQFANNIFLLEKKSDRFEPTTYQEVKEEVYLLGAGLRALGVEKGDKIALLSEGCNLWIMSELALFYAGAVNVPLSVKLEESNDLLFRLTHAEAKYLFVSVSQLKKIRTIADQLPLIRQIIVLDEMPDYQEKEISINAIREKGREYLESHSEEEFLRVARLLGNDDYATITYTSGTTADPKGVVLTHRNYTANVEQALTLMDLDQSWRTLIILPLDHCFAHVVGFYIFMAVGGSVATVQTGRTAMESLKNIPLNIKEVKPNLILSVPALAKNFRKNIEQAIRSKGKATSLLFHIALRTCTLYNGDGLTKGSGWRIVLKPLVSLFDKLLFAKIRENFGGELRFFVGGGALLGKDLQEFFYAIGIPMYQGYGLSEATPIISSNGPYKHRFGSSGVLVQPLDLKILNAEGNELPVGEKGEIVIRGENVMAGYWKNPEATAETVREGWLYTGDLGYLGHDGLLYVLGRFKSLLIGSDGEKYSPEGIEEALVGHSPYIDQVMLYNNQSPYTTALIVPNKEQLRLRLKHLKLQPESEEGKEASLRILQEEIAKYKTGGTLSTLFPDRWLPATFAVLSEPFTEQNLMINSTMKMVRGKIEKAYQSRIDFMYTAEGKNMLNDANKGAL